MLYNYKNRTVSSSLREVLPIYSSGFNALKKIILTNYSTDSTNNKNRNNKIKKNNNKNSFFSFLFSAFNKICRYICYAIIVVVFIIVVVTLFYNSWHGIRILFSITPHFDWLFAFEYAIKVLNSFFSYLFTHFKLFLVNHDLVSYELKELKTNINIRKSHSDNFVLHGKLQIRCFDAIDSERDLDIHVPKDEFDRQIAEHGRYHVHMRLYGLARFTHVNIIIDFPPVYKSYRPNFLIQCYNWFVGRSSEYRYIVKPSPYDISDGCSIRGWEVLELDITIELCE